MPTPSITVLSAVNVLQCGGHKDITAAELTKWLESRTKHEQKEPVDKLISMKEAATRLGTCKRTVRNWIASGKLPARKQGTRYVRILEKDLADFVANLEARPVTVATDTQGEG